VVALAKACVGKQVLDVAVAEMLLPEEALGDLKVRREEEGGRERGRVDSDLKSRPAPCGRKRERRKKGLFGAEMEQVVSVSVFLVSLTHHPSLPPSLPPCFPVELRQGCT